MSKAGEFKNPYLVAKSAVRLNGQVWTLIKETEKRREWCPKIEEGFSGKFNYGKGKTAEQHLRDAAESLMKANAALFDECPDDVWEAFINADNARRNVEERVKIVDRKFVREAA